MQGNMYCCLHFNLKMLKPSLQLQAWCSVILGTPTPNHAKKIQTVTGSLQTEPIQFSLNYPSQFGSFRCSSVFYSVRFLCFFAILISININNSVQFGIRSCSLVFYEGSLSLEIQNWCTEPL